MKVDELLEQKDISYKASGRDFVIRCLNPEHEDRNPSLRIDKITGIFQCMSCGYKGSIFAHFGERVSALHLKRERLKEKLAQKLAESVGLQYPADQVPFEDEWRGICAETYKYFESFTCHQGDYNGRLIFPIKDTSGRICAFIGRHMTGGDPKYIISPPGARIPLYPNPEPIQSSVILVEGIFDAINLYDKGITNAVACFGVNTVTEEKLAPIKMKGVSLVYTFFDGDSAGQKGVQAVEAVCNLMDLQHKNIYLEDKDPGELSLKQVQQLRKQLYGES